MVLAVTGGIGTGKSTVMRLFATRGWHVLYADVTAKEVMSSDASVKAELVLAFGSHVMVNDMPDSELLRLLIFGNTPEQQQNRMVLNSIVHPRVAERHNIHVQRYREAAEAMVRRGRLPKPLAIESALMPQAHQYQWYDALLLVRASLEQRIERVMARSGLRQQQVKDIIEAQRGQVANEQQATYIIDNNGSTEELLQITTEIAVQLEGARA
jgi:dephospho-CoA kinase